MEYFSVIGGLILLMIAGDKLVEGAVAIADSLQVSRLVIGITVVSFGTSAPELVVGVDAALSNAADLALGNVVGSNIANVLLVLGIPALIFPFVCQDSEIRHSLIFMLLASLLLILLGFFGPLHAWQGILLLTLLGLFLFYSIRRAKSNIRTLMKELDYTARVIEDIDPHASLDIPLSRAIFLVIIGLVGLIIGAHLLVEGAITIARTFDVSEAVIGLTIVAVGTSLPELVTSLSAARNNHGDVALGNIIGSNLFNILAIIGVTSIVAPIDIADEFLQVDFWVMLGSSLALVPFALGKLKINRMTGLFFCTSYLVYLYYLASVSGLPI